MGIVGCWFQPLQMLLVLGLCISILCSAFWVDNSESTEREFDVGVDDNYVKKTGHRLSYDIPDSAHRSGVKHRLRRSTFGFTEIDHKADEGYGSWSKWSKCSKNCGIGWQFRKRICYNTRHCRNGDLEEKICEGIRC